MTRKTNPISSTSRRDFLTTSAATITAASLAANVHAAGSDMLRVGLIGCGRKGGGRGRGAATNCVNAGPNVQLYALADLFPDHLEGSRTWFKNNLGEKFNVSDDRCFTGWDAYQKLLALKEIDVVCLATPPGFRPLHLKAAVAAGKHIFAEKPVAVDAPGCRMVHEACEEAKKKGLSLVSGLCWRYHPTIRETMARVHEGAIGDLLTLQCTYNTSGLWREDRQASWSDVEWQVRNWLYFTWLSGDFNVEQHIHSLDKMAWAMRDEHPLRAVGMGGRQARTGPEYGHIYDHHSVVYEYKDGVKLFASCRQQDGCAKDVSDHLWGTKGGVDIETNGATALKPWGGQIKRNRPTGDMYQLEHDALIASIREGKPINNGDYMTRSTLLAIMGRMASYTGQVVTWEQVINSKEDLAPATYEFGPRAMPAVARPGITKLA